MTWLVKTQGNSEQPALEDVVRGRSHQSQLHVLNLEGQVLKSVSDMSLLTRSFNLGVSFAWLAEGKTTRTGRRRMPTRSRAGRTWTRRQILRHDKRRSDGLKYSRLWIGARGPVTGQAAHPQQVGGRREVRPQETQGSVSVGFAELCSVEGG
jgi:hypothetical protein